MQQLLDDVLDILADVTCLGQRRRVCDRKWNIQKPCQSLGEQRLAATGRANQEDVAFRQFDVVFAAIAGIVFKTFVVVVDGHGQHFLRTLLADHVLVENRLDILRLRQRVLAGIASILKLFADDVVTEFYAFVADEYRGSLRSACVLHAGSCRKTSNRGSLPSSFLPRKSSLIR